MAKKIRCIISNVKKKTDDDQRYAGTIKAKSAEKAAKSFVKGYCFEDEDVSVEPAEAGYSERWYIYIDGKKTYYIEEEMILS